jgi:hypothetical protein
MLKIYNTGYRETNFLSSVNAGLFSTYQRTSPCSIVIIIKYSVQLFSFGVEWRTSTVWKYSPESALLIGRVEVKENRMISKRTANENFISP